MRSPRNGLADTGGLAGVQNPRGKLPAVGEETCTWLVLPAHQPMGHSDEKTCTEAGSRASCPSVQKRTEMQERGRTRPVSRLFRLL